MGTKKPRHLYRHALKKDIIDGDTYYVECIAGIFVENKIDISVFEKDLNGKKYDKFEVRRNLSNYRNFFYSMIEQGKLFVDVNVERGI